MSSSEDRASRVDLYWLPLGAGGNSVRLNGRIFEAASAAIERRPRQALYHSALAISCAGEHFVIELTPVPDRDGRSRGAVVTGPVGARWAGRWRWLRYEVRCWHDGNIPDLAEAVGLPLTVSTDAATAARVVELTRHVPALVWGRDESSAGEMWNSNSVTSWLLERAGLDTDGIALPDGGRAPGWKAGIVVGRQKRVSEAGHGT